MQESWAEMVSIGRVVRPHGNKGHVVVAPDTDFGAVRFQVGATVYASRSGRVEPMRVTASREHQSRWVVALDAAATIDEAEALRDLELRIPAEALQTLGEGGYYVHDLVGCQVETTAGAIVGTVAQVLLGPGAPLLGVATDQGEVLVPLAEAICRRVDVGARRIVIDPLEGLIELNRRSVRADDR
jgi:16S rRNA processing protein RimM